MAQAIFSYIRLYHLIAHRGYLLVFLIGKKKKKVFPKNKMGVSIGTIIYRFSNGCSWVYTFKCFGLFYVWKTIGSFSSIKSVEIKWNFI